MSAKPFSHPIDIKPADIDFMGHVNNARYLGWVQDAVLAHWQKFAPAEAVAERAWVALKHEISYRSPAFLDERVDVQMLIDRYVGARAYFDATIRRGETVLAEVKSVWCSVDVSSLRPVRLAREIRASILGGSKATA